MPLTKHLKPDERRSRPWSVTILRAIVPGPPGRPPRELWQGKNDLPFYRDLWASGSAHFAAVYLQDPSGLTGLVFKPEWLRYWAHANYVDPNGKTAERLLREGEIHKLLPHPSSIIRGQAHDLAISEKESADYYVRINGWASVEGDMFIDDVFRNRLTVKQMVDDMRRAANGPPRARVIAIESTAFQSAIFQQATTRSMLPFKKVDPSHQPDGTTRPGGHDKVSRARPVAYRYESGNVYHRYKAPWLQRFEAELLAFPGAAHDDQVDALAYLYEELAVFKPRDWKILSDLQKQISTPRSLPAHM